MSDLESINECRLCGSPNLEEVFSLGVMANASVFPASPDEPVREGPLTLVKCMGACGLVQLAHRYGREDIDAGHYGYRSGLNQTMVDHLRRVANLAMIRHPDARSVLDIGANDGTLLNAFPAELWRCGVEPNYEQFADSWSEGIHCIPEYFDAHLHFKDIDIITSIAVLYDLEDPLSFVELIRDSLSDDGIWVTEQSYLPTMLDIGAYDAICHEHVEYYSLEPLLWMASVVGLNLVHLEQTPTNGGSLLAGFDKGKRPRALISHDDGYLTTPTAFKRFGHEVYASKVRLHETLARHAVVHGLGASTKGNIILQNCRPNIPMIAEVNPDKFGRYTPGTHIPIVTEEQSRAHNPDAYLVLPWHFKDSFIKRYPGDTLIFPI